MTAGKQKVFVDKRRWTLEPVAWRLALRNLTRNVRRNLATGSALALGFAGLLSLLGFLHSVDSYLAAYTVYGTQVGHITLYKKHGFENFAMEPKRFSFSPAEQGVLKSVFSQHPELVYSSGQLQGSGLISNGCDTQPFQARALESETEKALRVHPELARWNVPMKSYFRGQSSADFAAEFNAIQLSSSLAKQLQKQKVYGEFQDHSTAPLIPDCSSPAERGRDSNVQLLTKSWNDAMNIQDAEVVGLFSGKGEGQRSALLMPLNQLQSLMDTDHVSSWALWLKDPQQSARLAKDLVTELQKQGVETETYLWTSKQTNSLYAGTMNFLHIMIVFLGCVLVAIVVFSIFNASTMTAIERSQETGMMRSLGFDRSALTSLFAMEVLLLSLLSVAVGGVLGFIGIEWVESLRIKLNPPGLEGGMDLLMTPGLLASLATGIILVVLTTATALFVQRRIAGQRIIQLLSQSNR